MLLTLLQTYTDSGSKVNVNGAKGKVSATSSDDSVAKVSCSSNESEKEIYVSGVSEGNATITVTDSDGNSAILKVEVKNWTACWNWKIYRTMYVVNRKCLVEGVSSEDSAAIAADAIENDKYYKYYTFRTPTNNPFGVITKRLTITDSEGNTRMEGELNIQQNADNTEVWYLLPFKDYRAVVLATFYSDGESIFKDVTDNYKKTYPHIKKVELQAICAIEELEPDK